MKKHRAYFYQVLTPRNEGFHYFIKLQGKSPIALNMEFLMLKLMGKRKAKKRLSEQYDVTEDEIQKIIDKKIGEKLIDQLIEKWKMQ